MSLYEGDIDVLRLIREARLKSEESNYGTHMSFSMTVGIHFVQITTTIISLNTTCFLCKACCSYAVAKLRLKGTPYR